MHTQYLECDTGLAHPSLSQHQVLKNANGNRVHPLDYWTAGADLGGGGLRGLYPPFPFTEQ